MNYLKSALNKVRNISKSELSIYDNIEVGDNDFWLISQELEAILNEKLNGLNLWYDYVLTAKLELGCTLD